MEVFKPSILPKIKHCTENITLENSREFYAVSVGKTLIYKEGFDEITRRYGCKNFDEFLIHALEVPLSDISDIEFPSIVYAEDKM